MNPAPGRAAILLLTLGASLVVFGGCKPKETVPGKWFAGEPVEHWLEAMKAPDAKLRRRAAEVLGNVGPVDLRSITALADALSDPDRRVRDQAILGLSKLGPVAKASAPAIQKLLQHEQDPQVVAHANAALSRVVPPAAGNGGGSGDETSAQP